MSGLDPAEVTETFMACMAETTTGDDVVVVEGVIRTVAMSRAALAEHRAEVEEMAAHLPRMFFESHGGGWSFLNLCNDRDDEQWTSLHLTMEQLCSLLIGLDLASWLLPREMWGALPAGMPYLVVHDDDRFAEGVLG